jgi:integrase
MSNFVRQPLLSPEVEAKLKEQMKRKWLSGMPGKQIADELGFGKHGTSYEKVKPNYIYFYRQKFNLPTRNDPPFEKGTHRYKKRPKELGLMSPETFINTLNTKLPSISKLDYVKRARAYLILHYWTPLRSSEIYERVIDDFEIMKDKIIIHLLRKKKGHKPTDESEPIAIPRVFPLVDEVVEWLEGKRWQKKVKVTGKRGGVKHVLSNRPFHFGKDTANAYVKEVFEDYYPHYFRFNYITEGADDPDTTIAELKAKTKLTLTALEKYIITDEKTEEKFDKRKIKRLRAKGLVK